MKILGIIPARGGSKGVPGKNIKLLAGKPLLQYTSDVAKASKYLSKIVLSSDDDKIIELGKIMGLDVPFKRPNNLAQDKSPTLPVIIHALDFYANQGEFFDAVCLLQITSPFRTIEFLETAIETFLKNDTDSLVSVIEVPHEYNPHWVFEADDKGILYISTGESEIISRRQDLPRAFHRDGSVYLTKTEVLKHQNSLYGKSISYIESSKKTYVNIDTLEDWNKAEQLVGVFNKDM
ncbi:acylneuraminate cytidylyltransferase family protein [Formosa sediminum]|uniref:Acylneuraminate cytidylyltransferase family protein n=1 Tax=Formosa sediminum TaxID=2594004 RepID=A0A516GRP2_9FLAO|nr:acylneuraminate cytidylyltransferase family protein [Formosa sediminum]QDO94179.1 acylneuraminate cytidylyltransferase family protein [Formosa sediminum]